MKTRVSSFLLAVVLSFICGRVSALDYWDVQDGDYGYDLHFREQFSLGSTGGVYFTLPSAYWNVAIQLGWTPETGTASGFENIFGDVHARHEAVGSGAGSALESNPGSFFGHVYSTDVGSQYPSSTFTFGVDGYPNSLGGLDVAGGNGQADYDAQSGLVTVNGTLHIYRTPTPAGYGVPDVSGTFWLAVLALGATIVAERVGRKSRPVLCPMASRR